MELVTVKTKFQIIIPRDIRDRVGLGVGDLLEASVENGKITLTPQSLAGKHIAAGLADLAAGRTQGPYDTAAEAITAVERRISERAAKASNVGDIAGSMK